MKPGDHPDFFRFAPPPGTSRESTLVLDRDGNFTHDGQPVPPGALADALHRWIARHPDDGRLILTNGYDWCYFKAEDAPYVVRHLVTAEVPRLALSDGSEERLDPRALSIGADGVVYAKVKEGGMEARFSRHAQTQLAPYLVEADEPMVEVSGERARLPSRPQ